MERPKTQYAKSGDLHVAYQTLGQGPPDIVFVAPYMTHVEAMWEIPQVAHYLEGLARIGRLLLFDAVGSGLSDPLPGRKRTLDSWTNDVRVVMDAVGLTRGVIHGNDSAGAMAMLFAATYPERVSSLILVNTFAKVFRTDDYPAGQPEDRRDGFVDWWHPQWGKGTLLRWYAPSAEVSEEDIERSARLERQIASPGSALTHMNLILDWTYEQRSLSSRRRRWSSTGETTKSSGSRMLATSQNASRARSTWSCQETSTSCGGETRMPLWMRFANF